MNPIRDEWRSDDGSVRLILTRRQAYRLRMLLLGEIGNPGIEQTHRRTWTEIVGKLDRFPLFEQAAKPRQLELLDAGDGSVSVPSAG